MIAFDFGSSSQGLSNSKDHHSEFFGKTVNTNSPSALPTQEYEWPSMISLDNLTNYWPG